MSGRAKGVPTVPCRWCGRGTTMLGTRMCDRCWELDHRIQLDVELAQDMLAMATLTDGERTNLEETAAHLRRSNLGVHGYAVVDLLRTEHTKQLVLEGHQPRFGLRSHRQVVLYGFKVVRGL